MTTSEPRIVFLDAKTYGDVSLEQFTERWRCTIHEVTDPPAVAARLKDHAVVVTNKVALDYAVLNQSEARDLRLIAVAATGTDIIDRGAANTLGIRVCNVPGYATQSVAQFTMTLLLELATRAGKYGDAVKAGVWQRSPVFSVLDFPTTELNEKKLGIIGYGNIGRTVATMGRAFGMEVLIAARLSSESPISHDRISLEQLLRQSDVITLHCPLSVQTQNLINEKTLSWMKPTAFLINTARGALIDERALIAALRNRRIAGAALDVISREPPPADHPIIEAAKELDNLLVTPHTAWSARESRERLLSEVARNISAFFEGRARNLVE
jgi:glycerate dehydrogenase